MPLRQKSGRKSARAVRSKASASEVVPPLQRIKAVSRRPFQIEHLRVPPRFAKPRRIHPRRLLPLIRGGLEREFHSASLPVAPQRSYAAVAGPLLDQNLVLQLNTPLVAPGQQQTASNVDEPSAAINGDVVFFTGNWYAAMSSDGGKTFSFINPAAAFASSDPPNSHFCCDQVVNYIPSIDTFVWLLQYGPEAGDNIQRLAFAQTADVVSGKWRLFDITTAMLKVPGAFLDFPDLAVGSNSLYVTTNIFQADGGAGSTVVRIPLAEISANQIAVQPYVSQELQSFRVAQNCGSTAFFAAQQDTSTLALFSWDETQPSPSRSAVGVARWIGGNGYQSRCPDGNRWLDRADPRITGATLAGDELWFAWGVDQGSNRRPNPFAQIARIDARTLTLVDNVNLFDPDSAICYAALSSNALGEVGVSYMIGGGPRNPSPVVGILTGTRQDVIVAQGDRGPLPDSQTGKGEWGDFLTVRRAFPSSDQFAATGYAMQGAADGSNRDATPRFVIFGRSGSGITQPGPVVTPVTGPTPPDVTGGAGPITDVNTLPLVSSAVALRIKQACGIGAAAPQVRPMAAAAPPEAVTKPGIERWPVKTGQDQPDRAAVGKNIIAGENLGAGVVSTTVEELVSVPRPPDMADPNTENPAYQSRRSQPLETTIWRLDATITALKLEADGDYHLVLQGASGETMIAEVPTPTPAFIGDSPWQANIQAARQAVDDKLVKGLSPAAFVQSGDYLVPREAGSSQGWAMPQLYQSFLAKPDGNPQSGLRFKTAISPTPVRITGVGFFDKVHGQMGVSVANGIELHPVLKVEWR